jgi:hypothetical protein
MMRRQQLHRLGYTLLEMAAASLGAGILLVGLSSSLMIALRATDTSQTPTSARIKANDALLELEADLEFALAFTEQSAWAVTILVPDQNGDAKLETIRYAWTGTPGDPLTRQYNGGAAAVVLENVHIFQHDLPAPSSNRLTNPGMEAGTQGFEAITGATLSSASTPVHQGSLSLRAVRNSASNESGLRQNVTAQLSKGTPYKLSAWVRKTTQDLPYDVRLQLRLSSTGSGVQTFSAGVFPISSTQFRRVKGTVTPTWSGTLLSAYWECTGVDKFQEIYVDDAELKTHFAANQSVNISLQVGADPQALVQSGVRLLNSPL